MSTAAIDTTTLPSPNSTDSDDDGVEHLVCCDDDIALCGLYVPTEQYPWHPDEETTCPLCRWAEDEGLPCTIAGCPGGAV